MMRAVVKAQVIVEGSLIEMLEACGKDPAHYFFTSKKIKPLRDIDTGVGRPMWDLLLQASYVRNELVHSLNEAKIKKESDKAREAYLAWCLSWGAVEDLLDASRDRIGNHVEVPILRAAGRGQRRRVLLRRGDQQSPAG